MPRRNPFRDEEKLKERVISRPGCARDARGLQDRAVFWDTSGIRGHRGEVATESNGVAVRIRDSRVSHHERVDVRAELTAAGRRRRLQRDLRITPPERELDIATHVRR